MNAFHNIRLFIIIGSFIITHVNALECDAVKLCANNACCSQWNFCGTGDAWCGAGCLSGSCTNKAASVSTIAASVSTTAASASTTAATVVVSTQSPCFNLTVLQCILSSSSSSPASLTSATTQVASSTSTILTTSTKIPCFNLTLLQCILSSSSQSPASTTTASATTQASSNKTSVSTSTYSCTYETCNACQCCSQWGYCGNGDAWCGAGCKGGPCYSTTPTNANITCVTTTASTTPPTPTTPWTTTLYTGPPTTAPNIPCLITWSEFTNAVLASGSVLTKFGYNAPPPPSVEQYTNLCNGAGPKGSITTKQQLAMFLAQICWESIGLKEKRELICIASGCVGTYGNGAPGQGYYGRGYMQLSWPGNYEAASQALFGDNRLWQTPDLVASNDQYAWDTAFWYWRAHVGNTKNFGSTTMAINGGLECNGPYRDRARGRYDIYVLMMNIFNITEAPIESGCYN